MTRQKFKNRNKLDIILTDSRPVELPKNYTLEYFYNYLNSNEKVVKMFERVKKELRASDEMGNIWGSNWHSTPLKFHIYKNRFEMREMSLISPLSMIELSMFVEGYEKQLLLLTSEEGFSVRKHKINDELKYRKSITGKGIAYECSTEKKMEFSGDFYSIYPYKYIFELQNSDYWYQLNGEYRYFGKIDYSKCFDSIYTHTFTWLITKNSVDGKNYGQYQYFLNICDKLMQNINGSVTNGIVVGPEFSRLMMELLAQHIDKCVKSKLFKLGKIENKDYTICRYVDDIYVFADEEKTIELIVELYGKEAEIFHFRLNDQKLLMGKLPYNWFAWKKNIHSINEYVSRTLFGDTKISKNVIVCNPHMIANMKMLFQTAVADYPDYQSKITSYVLTTIYKTIVDDDKPLFPDANPIRKLLCFLDSVFYFYSFSMSFNNTEKVISILYVIGEQIPGRIFRDCLHKVICDYSLPIAKSNPEDIVNLFLLLSMYKIEAPDVIESNLLEKVDRDNSPLMHAVLLQYFAYDRIKKDSFRIKVESKIKEAISDMYKDKEFFMYTEAWWLYIFVDCPLISKRCRNAIRQKLQDEMNYLNRSSSTHLAKEAKTLVVDFLLDNNYPNKFIDWKMKREDFYKYTVFTTYNRTLFNGYNIKMSEYADELY